jgi:hypothetical protein
MPAAPAPMITIFADVWIVCAAGLLASAWAIQQRHRQQGQQSYSRNGCVFFYP